VSGTRYALVAGGGTAGHLQPALAIAEALVEAGHDRDSIEFVGSTRGQDRITLEGRGFPFTLLPGRGIVRSLQPRDVAANVGAAAGLAVAAVRGIGVVNRAQPRVVVSVGGYASLAASMAAVVRGVPLVLVNVDAVAGAANRLLGRFARASAVGWEGSLLPRAVVTGTPVRPEIAAVGREAGGRQTARRRLGLPTDRLTVVVFGGSLGAHRINRAVFDLTDRWKDRPDRSIYHIVGRREWEERPGAGTGVVEGSGGLADPDPAGLALVRVPYRDGMEDVYAAADVVVCRAGAMTVAELTVAGVPSILVPLPGAPGDHQTANARVLERAGAALLLADDRCDAAALDVALEGLASQPGLLQSMGVAARALGRPDAAAAAARVVESSAAAPRREAS
jgi:UDP-N-acetylglucosamine--N-acetylmuramyl-(pentapeptide) pyrophosphoryl-undecaprenol N-acetylglucosamine transferase